MQTKFHIAFTRHLLLFSACFLTLSFALSAQTYCTARSTSPWEQWIERLTVGTNAFPTTSKEGYGNFINQTPASVVKGQAIQITLAPQASWLGDPRNATLSWGIWIDYNKNGVFTDAGEEVVSSAVNWANGVFSNNTKSITAPTTATIGTTRMRVAMKLGGLPTSCETFEKGEVEDYTIQITEGGQNPNLPDFTVSNLIAPVTARNLDTISLSFRFQNLGTIASGNGPYVELAAASLVAPAGNEYFLGQAIRYNIVPNGFDTIIQFTSIIRDFIPLGNYTLRINADPTFLVSEANENNNIIERPFQVLQRVTDNRGLRVTAVTGSNQVDPNGTLSVSLTIKNTSALPSTPDSVFMAKWGLTGGFGYFSEDYAPNRFLVPALQPNQSVVIPASFTMPSILTNDVLANIDTFIRDYSEPYFITKTVALLNNSSAPVPLDSARKLSFYFPIVPRTQADLALVATQLNPTWDSINNSISLRIRITNNGTAAARNVFAEVARAFGTPAYAYPVTADFTMAAGGAGSLERRFTRTGVSREEVGYNFWVWSIPTLAAGASVEATFNGKVLTEFFAPQTNTFFYHDVDLTPQILYADVRDVNRGNDTSRLTYRFVRTTSNLPDLTLANLNIPTPSVQAGQILNWRTDVRNIGTAAATGTFSIKAYISTDNILRINDIQDGIIPTGNYAAGLTQTQIAGASTIPSTLATGNYYLILKVDADNQVTESNENNNVLVSATPFAVTAPPANCAAKFDLVFVNQTNCGYSRLVSNGGVVGSLSLYDNANPLRGAFFSVNDAWNRGAQRHIVATSGSITPPTGKVFTNCVRNWIYYVGEGRSALENRETDRYVASFAFRMAYLGNASDSIIVEISSTDNSFFSTTFISTAKILDCNSCSITDRIPPVFNNCPNQTATVSTAAIPNGTILTPENLISALSINPTDNCSLANIYLNNYQYVGEGSSVPLTLVAFDAGGNRAACAFTLNVVPPTTTTYCASKGTAPWEIWVSNVQFGTINNTSDKFKDFATLGYSDYSNLSTTVSKGTSYPLSITPSLSWVGNLPNAYARVWIDFNNNKTFEANELVLEKTNSNPLTANVLVPNSAVVGNVRMRVAIKWGAYPTACETFERGEVEDYTIQITGDIQNLPDLTLANLTTTYFQNFAGHLLNWKVDIKNMGSGAATGNFNVKAYFSADTTLSADDIYDGIIPTGSYAAGFQVLQVAGSSIIPVALPEGERYLILKADADNQVTESSETNNTVYLRFIVEVAPSPDLIITNVAGQTTGIANGNLTVNITIKNQGGINSQTDSVKLIRWKRYSNTTGFYRPDNYSETVLAVPPIAAGQQVTITGTFKLPPQLKSIIRTNEVQYLEPYFGIKSKLALSQINGGGTPANASQVGNYSYYYPIGNTGQADVSVTATVIDSIYYKGDPSVSYRVKVTNAGPNTAKNVFVMVDNTYNERNFSWGQPHLDSLTLTGIGKVKIQIVGNPQGLDEDFLISKFWQIDSLQSGQTVEAIIKAKVTPPNFGSPDDYDFALTHTLPILIAYGEYNDPKAINNTTTPLVLKRVNAGSSNDIALSITATPSVYKQWTNNTFRISVKNTGNQAFTNVKIEFLYPAKAANGGQAVPSIGTWQEYCAGGLRCFTWSIPNLAANSTATLDLPLFILDATGTITATAKLLSSTPTDNNAANNTATISLNPTQAIANQALARYKPTQLIPIVVQSIQPTISEDVIFVDLESIVAQEVYFTIFNTTGKPIRTEKRKVEKGDNRLFFEVLDLPQGMYFIQPKTQVAKNVPLKFVKM